MPMLAGAVFLVCPGTSRAQDAQYWTNDYGNRARLLGGAMVGSASDLSAVYYNPGRLALLKEPEAFLTGYVFNYDYLKVTDPDVNGEGITSSRVDAAAALVAGELRLGFLGDSHLAYSFLNRSLFDVRLRDDVILEGSDLEGVPNLDLLAGNVGYETRLSEYWAGLTWAKPLGGGLGFGISSYVAVRSHRGSGSTELQALSDMAEATVVTLTRGYNYDSWRILWKIGLGWEKDRWGLGLTLTTPGLKLWGSGEEAVNQTLVSQAALPDGSLPNRIAVDFQQDLPSEYNSPVSVAVGAAYSVSEATRVHTAAEWFASNDRTILTAAPFEPQTGGVPIDPSVRLSMKSLVNAGIGVEHVFSKSITSYASFRTDFSGAREPRPTETTFAIWDLYHLGAGVQATVNRSDFTLGLMYSWGSKTRENALLDGGVGGGGVFLSDQVRFAFRRLTLLLGFQLAFAPEL